MQLARRAARCSVVLLLLAAQQCAAIRSLEKAELVRPVHRWGRKGKLEEKAFKLDQMARAGFDPEYAVRTGDVDLDQLGLEHSDLDDEDRDTKHRLREKFKLIDINRDGLVSATELAKWIAANGRAALERRMARQFAHTDVNKDGKVSFAEYLVEIDSEDDNPSLEDIDGTDNLEDWLHTIKTAFFFADVDRDKHLNQKEYLDFQNPEESTNEKLKFHVTKQDVDLRDDDGDGRLSFDEFYDGYWSLFDIWLPDDHVWSRKHDREKAEHKFAELDTDKDGRLSSEELHKAFDILHPSEERYALLQAASMIEEADHDADQQLSLQEALNHWQSFYATTSEEPDYSYHDEL